MKTLSEYLFVNLILFLMCVHLLPTLNTDTTVDPVQKAETMYVLWACMSLMYVLMSNGFSKTIDIINDNCSNFTMFRLITVVYVISFGLLYLAGFNLIFKFLYL